MLQCLLLTYKKLKLKYFPRVREIKYILYRYIYKSVKKMKKKKKKDVKYLPL